MVYMTLTIKASSVHSPRYSQQYISVAIFIQGKSINNTNNEEVLHYFCCIWVYPIVCSSSICKYSTSSEQFLHPRRLSAIFSCSWKVPKLQRLTCSCLLFKSNLLYMLRTVQPFLLQCFLCCSQTLCTMQRLQQ